MPRLPPRQPRSADPLFKTEILPVLEKNCVQCHGPQHKMAKLDLSSFTGMMEGSSSGPVIAPGKPERSLMWKLIESDQMPQGGKLTVAEKQLIKSYIQYGRFPQATAETEAAMRAKEAAKITPQDRNWWSFRKPVKSAGAGGGEQGPGTHADRRLHPGAARTEGLEDAAGGRSPHPDPARLLRPDRTAAHTGRSEGFRGGQVAERLGEGVDRLLASPHYGEQWGRHWLDVAGYSDSRGDAGDSDREVSWKYRDYVIHAFNKNKPINQFILEQMAGDQLVNYKHLAIPTPDQIEPLTATGFMRTTADITDNQTIYEVDKYFDAQQKAMETSLYGVAGRDHPVRPLPRPQVRPVPAEGLLQADGRLSAGVGSGELASRRLEPRTLAEPHGARYGRGLRARHGSRTSPATTPRRSAAWTICWKRPTRNIAPN